MMFVLVENRKKIKCRTSSNNFYLVDYLVDSFLANLSFYLVPMEASLVFGSLLETSRGIPQIEIFKDSSMAKRNVWKRTNVWFSVRNCWPRQKKFSSGQKTLYCKGFTVSFGGNVFKVLIQIFCQGAPGLIR